MSGAAKISVVFLLLLAGCLNKPKPKTADEITAMGLRQEKVVNNVRMELAYIPSCGEKADKGMPGVAGDSDFAFRLRVFPAADKDLSANALSYGIDTLFSLEAGAAALQPVMAQRIANGNLSGVEYLLVFDRTSLKNVPQCKIVFKDYLFTNTLLSFVIDIRNADKLDAISCNL